MTFLNPSVRQIDESNSVTIASPALPNDYGSEALIQSNDLSSPLLRLPAELRNLIYEFTFSNETIRLHPGIILHPGAPKYQPVISLLLTCQRTRKEATPIFNDYVVFDMTPHYDFMAAAYQLGVDNCRNIRAIQIKPDAANRMTWQLRLSKAPLSDCARVLPNLRRVCIRDRPLRHGPLIEDRESVVRVVRLHFGHPDLEVQFLN